MMASCDALPQAAAKLLLLSHIAIMAPLALVVGGAAQLLVCSVDTRCSQTSPDRYRLGNVGDARTLTAHILHSGACTCLQRRPTDRHLQTDVVQPHPTAAVMARRSGVLTSICWVRLQGGSSEHPHRQRRAPVQQHLCRQRRS